MNKVVSMFFFGLIWFGCFFSDVVGGFVVGGNGCIGIVVVVVVG